MNTENDFDDINIACTEVMGFFMNYEEVNYDETPDPGGSPRISAGSGPVPDVSTPLLVATEKATGNPGNGQ